jgi:hypothetical protein
MYKYLTRLSFGGGQHRDRFASMPRQDDAKNFEVAFQKLFKSAFEERRTSRVRGVALKATERPARHHEL